MDPVGPAAGSLSNFNRYDYANNNPIANIDPDGRQIDRTDGGVLHRQSSCQGDPACAFVNDSGKGTSSILFSNLLNNYPSHTAFSTNPGSAPSLWSLVGGHVAMNAWQDQARGIPNNTCAIRMSYALNLSGLMIPKMNGTVSGADGSQYFLRVRDLQGFLNNALGKPVILSGGSFSGPPGETGIISFNIPFRDATGHFTLWDRDHTVDQDEPYSDWPKPTSALFWSVP